MTTIQSLRAELIHRTGPNLFYIASEDRNCEHFLAGWSDDGGRTVVSFRTTLTDLRQNLGFLAPEWISARLDDARRSEDADDDD